ncbi:hypothetical protein RhiJN_23030 [Ceratobasidium sp. AG-Ba]|nr:hypothetical protein RhiJN_23030 [Ceratobasidium sp. AG-Ba]
MCLSNWLTVVQDKVEADKKARKKQKDKAKQAEAHKKAKESGRRAVGDTGVPLKNVLFLDIETGRPISQPDLFAQLPIPGTARDPDSIPKPARSAEFKGHGTIYWFAKAKDGYYHFVLGAVWRNHDEISETGCEHLDKFVRFAEQSVEHSFKVEKNWAQNRGKKKHGEIYMSGWHSSMRAGDSVTAYAPRPGLSHASEFDAYLDMNRSLKDAMDALIWAQETEFAPKVAEYTKNSLSFYGLPMAGSLDIDFKHLEQSHKPALGSSLSISRHDPEGQNYANGMHTDRDIDGHRLYQNVAYTTGSWCFGKDGKSVGDMELIKKSFTPAYLIFPKYRIALDLNSHSFLMGLWRGGLDAHGTTPSRVDLTSGLTRWGCSAQSNWGIPARLTSENRVRRNSDIGLCPLPTRQGPFEMVERRLERRRRNSASLV